MENMENLLTKIRENISKVMIGEESVITLLLSSFAAGGHVLLEDVPGTGKTVMAKSLARSMDLSFGRIQFTPDLLPGDVTGIHYFDQSESRFRFRPGPVFANVLLADEINRATPRTQSALLECMAEKQVTVDGETKLLEDPFFVVATQNPVETLGCYPRTSGRGGAQAARPLYYGRTARSPCPCGHVGGREKAEGQLP